MMADIANHTLLLLVLLPTLLMLAVLLRLAAIDTHVCIGKRLRDCVL